MANIAPMAPYSTSNAQKLFRKGKTKQTKPIKHSPIISDFLYPILTSSPKTTIEKIKLSPSLITGRLLAAP
jgi:hypothetical protein